MKFSRTAARKNSAAERVSLRGQMFGLRIYAHPCAQSFRFQITRTKNKPAACATPFLILAICYLPLCAPQARTSLLAFTRARAPIGFARAAEAARWESVMRYRSATVAGFHGLPCFPEVSKERLSAPVLAGTCADHKSFSYQCILIRR
jgi:hypothetical protein